MDNLNITTFFGRLLDRIIDFIPNIIGAILVLLIGIFAIKLFRRFMTRLINKRPDMDPTLIKFLK